MYILVPKIEGEQVYMWPGMKNSAYVHTKFDNFLDFEF